MAAAAAVSAADFGAEFAADRQTAISVRSVSKTFDGDVLALDGINFEVPEKQFISVLGPSGCGKSTLLRILGRLYSPELGRRGQEFSGNAVPGPRPTSASCFRPTTCFHG